MMITTHDCAVWLAGHEVEGKKRPLLIILTADCTEAFWDERLAAEAWKEKRALKILMMAIANTPNGNQWLESYLNWGFEV